MFGLIKNNIKTKIGIVLPASYPASRISHESVSVTGNGSKTYGQLFAELTALIDSTKMTNYAIVKRGNQIYQIYSLQTSPATYIFARFAITASLEVYVHLIQLGSTNAFRQFHATQSQNEIQDISSVVATNGEVITLYY